MQFHEQNIVRARREEEEEEEQEEEEEEEEEEETNPMVYTCSTSLAVNSMLVGRFLSFSGSAKTSKMVLVAVSRCFMRTFSGGFP